MKFLLSIIILFIPISILAKQICIAPSGCRIEQDTGFCPKCIDVKEEDNLVVSHNTVHRILDDVVFMKKEDRNRRRRKRIETA